MINLLLLFVDLIHKMLQADPSKRISLSEIRSHAWMQGETFI